MLANGRVLTKVSLGSSTDVDIAVKAAQTAFKTTWGLNCPGTQRAALLNKLADLIEKNADELAALSSLEMGVSQLHTLRYTCTELTQVFRLVAPRTAWLGFLLQL